MKIIWWVDDGLAGRHERTLVIDDDALDGLSAQERREYIEESVGEEFSQTIMYGWKEDPK